MGPHPPSRPFAGWVGGWGGHARRARRASPPPRCVDECGAAGLAQRGASVSYPAHRPPPARLSDCRTAWHPAGMHHLIVERSLASPVAQPYVNGSPPCATTRACPPPAHSPPTSCLPPHVTRACPHPAHTTCSPDAAHAPPPLCPQAGALPSLAHVQGGQGAPRRWGRCGGAGNARGRGLCGGSGGGAARGGRSGGGGGRCGGTGHQMRRRGGSGAGAAIDSSCGWAGGGEATCSRGVGGGGGLGWPA